MRDETTELHGFPYEQRGYSRPGRERSAVHPTAEDYAALPLA